ncbi:hypothetical protein TRIP_C20111 [Candidatus Zixiibacteriota bacterium]|nr:hypothetical protein TRIP_C20111 [candidate division Zixibacteria bacterium]
MRNILTALTLFLIMAAAGFGSSKDSVNIYLRQGGLAIQNNDLRGAIAYFESALRLDSSSANAWKNLGVIYSAQKNYHKSMECLQKARRLDTADVDIFNNLGIAYLGLNDTARALESYRHAVSRKPNNGGYARSLASLLLANKRYSEAASTLTKLLQVDSSDAEANFILGNIYFTQGNFAKSEGYYDKAVALNALEARYFYNQGVVKDKLGKNYEAEVAYKKSLSLEPNNFDVHQHLGVLYIGSQKFPEALDEFRTAVKLDPESDEARIALGAAYMYNDMVKEAKAVYDALQKRNPAAAQKMMDLIMPLVDTTGRR